MIGPARLATATLLSVALMCSACTNGKSGDSSDPATTTTTTIERTTSAKPARTSETERAVKFAECIRAHGVADFPDPDPHNDFNYGVSVSPEVWSAAVKACKSLQPPGTLSSKRTKAQQSASLRFAKCVREHGVPDFPDPANGEPMIDTYKIPSSNRPGGMDVLNAATDACADLLREAMEDRK